MNSNYDLKIAKLFTWCGRAVTLEELRRIKDYHPMGADERRFLTAIIAKFDMILGDIEISRVKKAMNDALDKVTGIDKEATMTLGNTISFRDWIFGKANLIGKNVLINEKDFELLASHYAGFATVEPRLRRSVEQEQQAIAKKEEKLAEDRQRAALQAYDAGLFANINLSYQQWKQRGRFVRRGEISTMYTLDSEGVRYALFSFAQTDVAEERYKSIKPRCENAQTCTCLNGCEDKR